MGNMALEAEVGGESGKYLVRLPASQIYMQGLFGVLTTLASLNRGANELAIPDGTFSTFSQSIDVSELYEIHPSSDFVTLEV